MKKKRFVWHIEVGVICYLVRFSTSISSSFQYEERQRVQNAGGVVR